MYLEFNYGYLGTGKDWQGPGAVGILGPQNHSLQRGSPLQLTKRGKVGGLISHQKLPRGSEGLGGGLS